MASALLVVLPPLGWRCMGDPVMDTAVMWNERGIWRPKTWIRKVPCHSIAVDLGQALTILKGSNNVILNCFLGGNNQQSIQREHSGIYRYM